MDIEIKNGRKISLEVWLSKVKAMSKQCKLESKRKSESGSVAKQSKSHEAWLSKRHARLGELIRFWTSSADVAET